MSSYYPGLSSQHSLHALLSGTSRELVQLPLLTGSMAPAILPGDLLSIRPIGGRKVHTGDVAVFYKHGRLTAHRIIFAFRLFSLALLLEKGDANRGAGLLDQRTILGTVVAIERGGLHISLVSAADQSRQLAHTMLWRSAASMVPSGRLRRILGV